MPRGFEQSLRFLLIRTVLFDQIVNRIRIFGDHYYSRIGDNAARFRTKFAVSINSNGFVRSNRESNSRFRGSLLFANREQCRAVSNGFFSNKRLIEFAFSGVIIIRDSHSFE